MCQCGGEVEVIYKRQHIRAQIHPYIRQNLLEPLDPLRIYLK